MVIVSVICNLLQIYCYMIIADSTHVDVSLLFRSNKLYSGYLLKPLRMTSGCIDLIAADRVDLPALSQGAET